MAFNFTSTWLGLSVPYEDLYQIREKDCRTHINVKSILAIFSFFFSNRSIGLTLKWINHHAKENREKYARQVLHLNILTFYLHPFTCTLELMCRKDRRINARKHTPT